MVVDSSQQKELLNKRKLTLSNRTTCRSPSGSTSRQHTAPRRPFFTRCCSNSTESLQSSSQPPGPLSGPAPTLPLLSQKLQALQLPYTGNTSRLALQVLANLQLSVGSSTSRKCSNIQTKGEQQIQQPPLLQVPGNHQACNVEILTTKYQEKHLGVPATRRNVYRKKRKLWSAPAP